MYNNDTFSKSVLQYHHCSKAGAITLYFLLVNFHADHLRCVCTSYAQHQQMQQASILLEKRVFTSFQNSFMLNGFGSSSQ